MVVKKGAGVLGTCVGRCGGTRGDVVRRCFRAVGVME